MINKKYLQVQAHYETCFEREGDSCRGVDWPNEQDARLRYQVMTGLFKQHNPATIADIGCGLGHYYAYLKETGQLQHCSYTGMDISEKMITACEKKYPDADFITIDLLAESYTQRFDYAVLNGVFTVKNNLSQQDMWEFFTALIQCSFALVDKGIAFNLMSKNVDWERQDLFHVSMDELSAFLTKHLSRHFEIKHQYGLYEYTVYLYKEAKA